MRQFQIVRETRKDVLKKIENVLNAISGNIVILRDNMSKKCCKCKKVVELNGFGKLKSAPDGHRYDCNLCRKEYRLQNKTYIQQQQQNFYTTNKETLLIKNKKYREENAVEINKQRKIYRQQEHVKERTKQANRDYLPIKKEKMKLKRKTDLNFQISEVLRSKIHKMIKGKNTSYKLLIGCENEFLMNWLEFRFDDKMNWNNFGSYWQIDHILPINSFNFSNENDKKICFHWTNLQPLTCIENRQKTNKMLLHYYHNNIVNVVRFNNKYNQFLGYQAVNESLQWLRKKTSGMVIMPRMICNQDKSCNEIGNPQPRF